MEYDSMLALLLFLAILSRFYSANNKTVVFIAGWPQSGTSMLHKFLSLHYDVSTMMEKCIERHGKRCENWNYEGQWLLSNATLRQHLFSGATCPVTVLPEDVRYNIFQEWSLLWKDEQSIYVEKSPQSVVKTLALRDIFAERGYQVKFIIVIKHPITINTMTPRKFGWRYEREVVGSSLNSLQSHSLRYGSRSAVKVKPELSSTQMQLNMEYFLHTMQHQYFPSPSSTRNCSVGWLGAYENLLESLSLPIQSNVSVSRAGSSYNRTSRRHLSKNQLRIVHYESFLQPFSICVQLLQFIFNSTSTVDTTAYKKSCDSWFTQSAVATHHPNAAATTYKKGIPPARRSGDQTKKGVHVHNPRRRLRLRGEDTGLQQFQFKAQLVRDEGERRIREFHYALQFASEETKQQWASLQPRLAALGYQGGSLFPATEAASYQLSPLIILPTKI